MSENTYGGASTADTDDVVDLILADHREFERLFRVLRNREEDRAASLSTLADLLVAHAEAEEQEVYPALKRKAPEDAEEIEHGHEEHSEGHEALLELLQAEVENDDAFEEKLEDLVEALNHHIDEEEREILNAARENVPDDQRTRLGRAFLEDRNRRLEGNPGDVRNVGRLVQEARERGEI